MALIEHAVNLGEIKFSKEEDILVCFGLGSCIGVVMYDSYTKIGGMAHVVLPTNMKVENKIQAINYFAYTDEAPAKYADSGLWYLLENLLRRGARKPQLRAKIAGGASILAIPIFDKDSSTEIGQRNLIAVKEVLKELKIPIVAEDIGGNQGRTMRFYNKDFRVEISTFGAAKKLL